MIRAIFALGVTSLVTLDGLGASFWGPQLSSLWLRLALVREAPGGPPRGDLRAMKSAGYALPLRPLGPGARFGDPVRASLDALRFIQLELPRCRSVEWGGYVRKLESEEGTRYTYDHPRDTTIRSGEDHVRIRIRPREAALWFHTHGFCPECPRGPSTQSSNGSWGDLAVSRKLGIPGVLLEMTSEDVFYFTGRRGETLRLTRRGG